MLQSQAKMRGLVRLSVCRRAISTLVQRHPLARAAPYNGLQPSIPALTRVAAFSTSSGTSSNSSSPPEGSPGMAGYVKRTNRMDPPDEHTTQDRRTSEPEPKRSTGDEVTADTRVEMAFNKVTGAVKSAAQKVKDVLNREDPINEAGEEGYGSLDRFKDTINMSSARGREQLEGHKWQQDRDAKRIDPESITSAKSTARNKRETGTGSGDVSGEGTSASGDSMSKAAGQVEQGVKGAAEKVGVKTEVVQKGAQGMTDKLKSSASSTVEKLSDKMMNFENRSADEANEQGKQASK